MWLISFWCRKFWWLGRCRVQWGTFLFFRPSSTQSCWASVPRRPWRYHWGISPCSQWSVWTLWFRTVRWFFPRSAYKSSTSARSRSLVSRRALWLRLSSCVWDPHGRRCSCRVGESLLLWKLRRTADRYDRSPPLMRGWCDSAKCGSWLWLHPHTSKSRSSA